MTKKRSRGRRIVRWTLGIVGGLLVAAIVGILVYSQVGVMAAEPEPLAAVCADERIAITDDSAAIVLAPAGASETGAGLVFIPGAKVDPWAYASILLGLVTDDGLTVVITKPWLNLAFFDLRPLSTFTDLAPVTLADTTPVVIVANPATGIRTMADLIAVARTCRALRAPLKPEPPGGACSAPATARTADRQAARGKAYCGDYSFEVFNDDYQLPLPRVAMRAWRSAEWLGEQVLRRAVPLPGRMRLRR